MKKTSALSFSLLAFTLNAADWPQFRGAQHDSSSPEKILTTWPQEGPSVAWKAQLGPSFGGFAIGGGRAFCFIQRSVDGADKEVGVALDVKTGKELWAAPLGEPTYDNQGGDGPRSTPTVDGDRAYFLGAYQVLSCLDGGLTLRSQAEVPLGDVCQPPVNPQPSLFLEHRLVRTR